MTENTINLATIYADNIRGAVDDLRSFIRRKEMFKNVQGIDIADLDKKIDSGLERLNQIADDVSILTTNNIEIKYKSSDPDLVTIDKSNKFRKAFYEKMVDHFQDSIDQFNDIKNRYKTDDQDVVAAMDSDLEFFKRCREQYQDKLRDIVGVGS